MKNKHKPTIIDTAKQTIKEFNIISKNLESNVEHFKSDPLDKLTNFFKQLEKFFKQIKKAFTFTKDKLTAIILTIIVPFFGQFFARLFYLNGSLYMPWLFFFAIPPLTLIPALFMMFELIPKAKGDKPYDYFIIIPIVINIFSDTYLIKFFPAYKIPFVKLFLILISTLAIYTYRSTKICNDKTAPPSKLLSDTLITNLAVTILAIAINYIPLIGSIFKIMTRLLPFSEHIIYAFSYLMVYIIVNMINGSSKKSYCKKEESPYLIIVLIIITIIISFTKNKFLNKMYNVE